MQLFRQITTTNLQVLFIDLHRVKIHILSHIYTVFTNLRTGYNYILLVTPEFVVGDLLIHLVPNTFQFSGTHARSCEHIRQTEISLLPYQYKCANRTRL